jgi:hypothetical protein
MSDPTVRRVHFGKFVRPAEETGTGASRVEPVLGYLVRHAAGVTADGAGTVGLKDPSEPQWSCWPSAEAVANLADREVERGFERTDVAFGLSK